MQATKDAFIENSGREVLAAFEQWSSSWYLYKVFLFQINSLHIDLDSLKRSIRVQKDPC